LDNLIENPFFNTLEREEYLGLNRCWKQLDRFGFTDYGTKKEILTFFVCLILVDQRIDGQHPKDLQLKDGHRLKWSKITSLSKSSLEPFFYEPILNNLGIVETLSSQIQNYCDAQLWTFDEFPEMEVSQLHKLIQRINELALNTASSFSLFLRFLQEKKTSKNSGQCFTPSHIANVMGALSNKIDAKSALDPSCGVGDLLTAINRHHPNVKSLEGWEIDPFLADCTRFNLWLVGQKQGKILTQNSLNQHLNHQKFDLIFANPPFGNENKTNIGRGEMLNTRTSRLELVFLDRIMNLVGENGFAFVILPLGFLHNLSKAHQLVRKRLIEEFHIEGIIEFPKGSFLPATAIRTAVVVFSLPSTKLMQQTIWYYKLQNDGFSRDQVRRSIPENDLPDLINSWTSRNSKKTKSSSQAISFLSVEEIKKNGYILFSESKVKKSITKHYREQSSFKELLEELTFLEEERKVILTSIQELLRDE